MSVISLAFLLVACLFHGVYSPTAPAAPSSRPLIQTTYSGQCSYISNYYSMCSLFFCFGGSRPLHNVRSLTSRSLTEDPTICFTISSPRPYLKILLSVLSFLRCSSCLEFWFLIPFLHSGPFQHLFSSVCPSWVLGTTLSLPCPLRHATPAQWVIPLQTVANFLWDPPLHQVCIFGFPRCPTARF
jgi:hypothetical protein